jgi:aspartate racemase
VKTIGLIGGMSWESSKTYYELINEETRRALGGSSSAECVMYSFDFGRIEAMQRAGKWDELGREIVAAGRRLKACGADFAVLCTNTMHKVVDHFESDAGLPLLHVADVIGEALRRDGVQRAGLLGTRFTMEEDFYASRIRESFGIEILVPDPEGIREVDRVIYEELVRGIVGDESRRRYEAEIEKLASRGCEGIILGCTEIGMLIEESGHRLYDSTILHAARAVELALAG